MSTSKADSDRAFLVFFLLVLQLAASLPQDPESITNRQKQLNAVEQALRWVPNLMSSLIYRIGYPKPTERIREEENRLIREFAELMGQMEQPHQLIPLTNDIVTRLEAEMDTERSRIEGICGEWNEWKDWDHCADPEPSMMLELYIQDVIWEIWNKLVPRVKEKLKEQQQTNAFFRLTIRLRDILNRPRDERGESLGSTFC